MSEPKTIYVCTSVYKSAEIDDFQKGCDPATRQCIVSEKCDIRAETLPGLIRAVAKRWDVRLEELWIPDDEDDVAYVGYDRMENEEGAEADPRECAAWKKGEQVLYLANYGFSIEKLRIEKLPLTVAEFSDNAVPFYR